MPRAAAPSAQIARVVVLRSHQAFALGALTERCDKHALILPAGPYAFPYAAAFELARLFHGNESPVNPDAAGLSRAALAAALRALALADRQIVAPRLDWLDASSLELIADVFEFAELAGSRLCLLAGLPSGQPAAKLARLLEQAQCADEEFDAHKPRALNTHDSALLNALRAAPMPLEPEKLMRASGLRAREFQAALRKLCAAGYADAGPRVGLGAASEVLPPAELTRWREAVLEVCDLPDARLSVLCELGLGGAEANELARRALAAHEPALALARFALAPSRLRDALGHARALAECGHTQSALAILQAEGGPALERARVAFVLAVRGALSLMDAERELRAAEREGRGGPHEVEAATLRATLLMRANRHAAALKLLRRITAPQAQSAPPDIRVIYLLLLAQAWRRAGREDKSRVLFAQAQDLSPSAEIALRVELQAFLCGYASAARLAQAAARAFDLEAARLALKKSPAARKALRHALGETDARVAAVPAAPQDALELCLRHGATLAATLLQGELRVLPAHAQAQAGLCAWLEAQLVRAAKSPGVLLPLSLPAREFKADSVLLLPTLGDCGPLIALFAKPANAAPLLECVNAREVVRQWLNAGAISAQDLQTLLEANTGENTPWPTSKPNSRRSNEPSTSH